MIRAWLVATMMLVPSVPASAATSAGWVVDPTRSLISFEYIEDGTPRSGLFNRFSADLEFDPARPQDTEATFNVQTASIDVGDSLREGVLVTTPWFDSERFPMASFALTSLSLAEGEGTYWADGTLTIKGEKRAVRLKTTVTISGDSARASGTLKIDRTDFRLRDVVLEAVVSVGPSVSIAFDLVAQRTE